VIDPGIKGMVEHLQRLGYTVLDSGDGTKPSGLDPYPYITIETSGTQVRTISERMVLILEDFNLDAEVHARVWHDACGGFGWFTMLEGPGLLDFKPT
jgi:hypothetical protein